jgi:FkbM family methyltransferase
MYSIKRALRSNDWLNLVAVNLFNNTFHPYMAKRTARSLGLNVKFDKDHIEIFDRSARIRISKSHMIYLDGVMTDFRYYADAVEPDENGIIDYSRPKSHIVKGYDLHPIVFPALAEPIATTKQYLEFANLKDGSVAIDLGAYSGLTAIMFRELCGQDGKVIAIDADTLNIETIKENFANYTAATGKIINLLEGAVWTHANGISFSREGNMGSSAVDIVGRRVKATEVVKSFTLANVAAKFDLEKVDFIKCDIEGGEGFIFQDHTFFSKYLPRIIVEAHLVDGVSTVKAVQDALRPYGYSFKLIQQAGEGLPLMECWVEGPKLK